MSGTTLSKNRIDLSLDQIQKLQGYLDEQSRGKIIVVPAGTPYDEDLETAARVGEVLTKFFTSSAFLKPGGWRVRFVLLDSELSNAYAYWMTSFEAICMTTTLAREIDTLSDHVAKSIVINSDKGGGFSFLRDLAITPYQKWAMLKGVLMQGAIATFVGHEAGHLAAGHKPVMIGTASAGESQDPRAEAYLLYVDDVISAAAAGDRTPTPRELQLNAHEVDADVQGLGLTARFWQKTRDDLAAAQGLPFEATLLKAACAQPERLSLVASTGAAIGISLMGYKTFKDDWNKQRSHPLTAVRCVVGLRAFSKLLVGDTSPDSTLQLDRTCMEALSVVHATLGNMLCLAAKNGGEPNDLTRRFEEAPEPEVRLLLMFNATGIAQAVTYSNQIVSYLAQLSAEFNACAKRREDAVRAWPGILVKWSAMVTEPSAAQATDTTTLGGG